MNKRILISLVSLLLVASGLFGQELAELFSENNPQSQIEVDHSAWDNILGNYLNTGAESGVNLFAYSRVSQADNNRLSTYLKTLETTNPHLLEKDEQMAYWINLYNALTIRVILDHYPIKSIRKISLKGSPRGPWKAKLVSVNGVTLSLDDIEHRILRPIWQDPRIHYAVNCASIGCPNLAPTAYTATKLEEMLEDAALTFINNSRAVDLDGKRLKLSSIYKWYKEDFGKLDQLKAHLLKYASSSTAMKVKAGTRPKYHYNWNLNEDS